MKIVAISDTHAKWKNLQIPECDILISCGDYTFRGEKHLVKNFHEWLNKQDAGYIISVQGNHETFIDRIPKVARQMAGSIPFQEAKEIAEKACPGVHFVEHGLVEIEGVKIFGSAWTPWFYDWAWNAHRGAEIKKYWDQIPTDIDILVTHGPPAGILDAVYYSDGVTIKERVGCKDLFDKILQCPNLKHHFFGHIHGSHGHKNFMDKDFWNVSICDEMYMPSYPVTVIEFDK